MINACVDCVFFEKSNADSHNILCGTTDERRTSRVVFFESSFPALLFPQALACPIGCDKLYFAVIGILCIFASDFAKGVGLSNKTSRCFFRDQQRGLHI